MVIQWLVACLLSDGNQISESQVRIAQIFMLARRSDFLQEVPMPEYAWFLLT